MLSEMEDLPSVKIGDKILRFELDAISQSCKDIAAKELRESQEIKAKAVEDLKELLKGTRF